MNNDGRYMAELYAEHGNYSAHVFKLAIGWFLTLSFFNFHTRVNTVDAENFFLMLSQWQKVSTNAAPPAPFFDRKAILMTLNYLREYPPMIQMASIWRVSTPTLTKVLDYVLDLINTCPQLKVWLGKRLYNVGIINQ